MDLPELTGALQAAPTDAWAAQPADAAKAHKSLRGPVNLPDADGTTIAMGRAIALRPSVFLMDEPLSSLDAKLRRHLRTEITQLVAELAVTTVYVTHDQSEAMALGDRVAVMRDGVLQQVSPPRELYTRPSDIFVAAFIGTPRVNLLDAVVHAPIDDRMTLDLGHQRLVLPEPLSYDHQLLRLQQGLRITIGLRSEAVRIALPSQARPDEAPLVGIVEHVDYQGHEVLVHVNTGSRPAAVSELEAPRTRSTGRQQSGASRWGLSRAKGHAEALLSRRAAACDGDPRTDRHTAGADERRTTVRSDLALRTSPHDRLRAGAQVPLLVDLAQLFVFDHQGRRVCPAPDDLVEVYQ